ncbi:hypothetical protein IGI04_014544, partial [Brassica rapa subsp. trilocularis]
SIDNNLRDLLTIQSDDAITIDEIWRQIFPGFILDLLQLFVVNIYEDSYKICYWMPLDFILSGFKLLGFKFVELQGNNWWYPLPPFLLESSRHHYYFCSSCHWTLPVFISD